MTTKGVDPIRAELDLYHKKAEMILRELDFSSKEYAAITRTATSHKK